MFVAPSCLFSSPIIALKKIIVLPPHRAASVCKFYTYTEQLSDEGGGELMYNTEEINIP